MVTVADSSGKPIAPVSCSFTLCERGFVSLDAMA
jgi:hypothetical protein